jgi:hypothetical protein
VVHANTRRPIARRAGNGAEKSTPAESEGYLVDTPAVAQANYIAARRCYVDSVKETDRLEKIIQDARTELAGAKQTRAHWAAEVQRAKNALARAIDAAEGLALAKTPDTDAEIPEE